jgi:hypothetical protein
MSANPAQKLLEMMAASQSKIDRIRDIHRRSLNSIPQRRNTTDESLNELRQKINAAGIGGDRASEDAYLKALRDRLYLDRSAALGEKLLPPDSTPPPPSLRKAIAYGELLLDIYGGGRLVKGAMGDVEAIAHTLLKSNHPQAKELAWKLKSLPSSNLSSASNSGTSDRA